MERHLTLHTPAWPKFSPFSGRNSVLFRAEIQSFFGPKFSPFSGRNSVLFRRPRHFEGTLATSLSQSDAAWLFLMRISERESLPKQTTNHRRLESKHHQRNSGSDSGRTGKDFSKIWCAGFNPVWTQMVATSSKCYDAVTFITQQTYSCSNFVVIP